MRWETDVIYMENNQISPHKNASDEIRSILLKHAASLPDHAFHITSDLNWLRYLKQAELLENVNGGVKLSNCGGIKLTTLFKSLPLVSSSIPLQPERL
jgi:hypothetical protein